MNTIRGSCAGKGCRSLFTGKLAKPRSPANLSPSRRPSGIHDDKPGHGTRTIPARGQAQASTRGGDGRTRDGIAVSLGGAFPQSPLRVRAGPAFREGFLTVARSGPSGET